ncbi:MAG: hypothetical protein MUO88_17000 [Desulfobacterales bacterium]|nr:hypothetical protein [Desulfobacterales bacterium]
MTDKHRDDPFLRSTRHVPGYRIHATDGEIDHVEDIILDDESWTMWSRPAMPMGR